MNVSDYAKVHTDEAVALLKTLASIPAPSGQERERATFCRDWLHAQGATQAYIDDALNVICPVDVTDDNPLAVICAHSDVVFPDTAPLPVREENRRLYCPGVGDDTANVVALLMAAKYVTENRLSPCDVGLLFVIDSCEEGLGNLKGVKYLMQIFGHRVREFISFDCYAREVITDAVGSRRFCISADTVGGHSYFDFGRDNAIAVLSSVIGEFYAVEVPDGTTYNVGTITGGTSVNTIAQHAEMLFELRSDTYNHLEAMQKTLDTILSHYPQASAYVIGERPCAREVDKQAQAALVNRVSAVLECHFGEAPVQKAGSTDCNVPLSMGIPAVCFGCILGDGMHTREEYVELDSVTAGLQAALDTVLYYF